VRAEATRAVRAGAEATRAGSVHYVGCRRACGRPPTGQVLVATEDGYLPVVG
ncbi:MAG TPA: precorrin-3B synthase, partial [Mycobacterium sp.]|nr:precorrin-3B synthase [Mycobacterium sp.]